jgi:hypothetical protein
MEKLKNRNNNMNQKRYWLRGLLVGMLLMFLILVGMIFSPVHCWYGAPCIPLKGISLIKFNTSELLRDLSNVIIILLSPLILATIIGWLYGKIKNRKSNTLKPSA